MNNINKTILLVEDEAIIALVEKKTLEKYGYSVITADTGEKAVETASSTSGIDLILMDIDLGEGIDGTEAAERILADKEIPLVFLSSHTEPEVVEKTEGITSYGYVVKNSGETVLIASIRMAFKLYEAKLKEYEKNEELHAVNEELEASNEEYMTIQEELFKTVDELRGKEEALSRSEKRVRAKLEAVLAPGGDISLLGLEDIFDITFIRDLMDDFYKINNIGGALLDINGKVLAASGWQDICTKFHRVNPESRKNCIESDMELSSGVNPGEFKIYKCKNNMWDMVTPVYIGGRHMGNLFLGQFLFEGEVPDYEIFREQARKYGFDEKAYLEALDRVPVWSREKVESVMSLYSKFAYQMGTLSYGNLKLARVFEEQKRISEKLKKSEDRFNRAIVGTGAGLWDWDMVNNTVFFSRKWKSMLGYEDHEVENDFSGWKNLWHPDDVTLLENAVNDYIEGKTNVYEIVHRLRHRDGSWHWILTRGDLERDETGKPIRWTGTNIDITGRKMAEEALRESEEKYRMLFHHSPLGIYVADCDGNILDANDKLLSILGSPSLEATKSLNVYNLPLLVETGYTDKFRESIKSNTVSSIEFNYTSKWGKTTYASNYIVPVADSAGKVEKVFTLVEDITLRKQIEKYRELSGEILSVLNGADDFKDSVSRILLLIKEETGSDAVGIRLCEGDDYPYFIQNGFSNDFILQENSLISRDSCGDICVNNDGDVSLECTCGLVISGKTDPDNPLFTPGGSCWTNDSFPLLEMPESEDPRYKARNNCIHHGYASVALVPVKSKNEIVGLLQLNGYARNLFTLELVQELEIIAGRIGETLLRKQNEDKIRALLKEKELLLKETHHRIKNNMNTVHGLLYLQAEELTDPVSKGIIKEAAMRVQSMMVMYDKLYRSESHHEMNINDYLPSLVDEIIRIFDSRIPVKTDIHVDDVVLSAKVLSTLGIIINELITNSMKYAFGTLKEGLISLSMTMNDNTVIVVYRDNGPGLPESVDFDNSTGFGMQLIGMLVNQLGGSIRIDRGEGTRFILEFDV
jgi:PAS domain S-box-containing protein